MDKNSFTQGYLLGCRLRGQRPDGDKPTAYLYGDMRLPKIPEAPLGYDATTFIAHFAYSNSSNGIVTNREGTRVYYCSTLPFYYVAPAWNCLVADAPVAYCELSDTGVWGDYAIQEKYQVLIGVGSFAISSFKALDLWTDTDIKHPSSGVFLSASEPIPVYD